MEKTKKLIASKARKVVRKRKISRVAKVSISHETTHSSSRLPPKLKRHSKAIELNSSAKPENQRTRQRSSQLHNSPIFETKSLEALQNNTARKLVELQLENSKLCREVKEREKNIKELNRQLRQEREFYEEQRWTYVQEIRATIKNTSSATTQTKDYIDSEDEDENMLANELRKVRNMFYKQRDISCKLSEKFLRIRDSRDNLKVRLQRLDKVYSTVIDELLKHIAEVRVYFASIKKGVLLERSAVASLVDRNAKLGYNNAILQLEILKYEKKLEGMRNHSENSIDGFAVEKFLAKCRSSRLLAICGGDKESEVVGVTRRGSFINIPVAVLNGNRVETQLAPLFSVVHIQNQKPERTRSTSSNLIKRSSKQLRQKTKSVPSKVWRLKYDMKPFRFKYKSRGKSEPELRPRTAYEEQIDE